MQIRMLQSVSISSGSVAAGDVLERELDAEVQAWLAHGIAEAVRAEPERAVAEPKTEKAVIGRPRKK
jgi:hypothetical protein